MTWPSRKMQPGTSADQTLPVAVSRKDLEDLDRLRGHLSRSSYMRRLLKDAVSASPAPAEEDER